MSETKDFGYKDFGYYGGPGITAHVGDYPDMLTPSSTHKRETVHVFDWERHRAARFGSCTATAVCTDAGELKALHLSGSVNSGEDVKALIGFLVELVK